LLQDDVGHDLPVWLQTAGLILATTGFALAVISVIVVGTVVDHAGNAGPAGMYARRRLRAGIGMTICGLTLLALAALSSWWPHAGSATAPDVTAVLLMTKSAESACGQIVESGEGFVTVQETIRRVQVPLNRVAALRSVGHC
jgi:hypothetical protein